MQSGKDIPSLHSDISEPMYELLSQPHPFFLPKGKKLGSYSLNHKTLISQSPSDNEGLILESVSHIKTKRKFVVISNTSLGSGAYSTVFKIMATLVLDLEKSSLRVKTKNEKAVKIQSRKDKTINETMKEYQFTQQAAPYLKMQAPIFVTIHNTVFSFLIMLNLNGNDVFDEHEKEDGYLADTPGKLNTALLIAKEVVDMHARAPSVLHCDIKPENFLLRVHNPRTHDVNVSLIDFGLARSIDQSFAKNFQGSLEYVDPFIFSTYKEFALYRYTKESDDFSTGLTLAYLLADEDIYLDSNDLTPGYSLSELRKAIRSVSEEKYNTYTISNLGLSTLDTALLLQYLKALIAPEVHERLPLEIFVEKAAPIIEKNLPTQAQDELEKKAEPTQNREQKIEKLTHFLPRFFAEKREPTPISCDTLDKTHTHSGYGR